MSRYHYFNAFYLSFFSGRFYIDVIRKWRGFGILYLLWILSILALPYSIRMMHSYYQHIDQKLFQPTKQLPPLSIRNGEVQFHSPMPYLIKNTAGTVVAIIDTTGKIIQLPYFLYPDASVLITKNALHTYLPFPDILHAADAIQPKESVSLFRSSDHIDFMSEDLFAKTHLRFIGIALMCSLYFVIVMLYLGLYLAILFAFGFVGQMIARHIVKVILPYQVTTRLVAVAATPQAVIYFGLLAINQLPLGMSMYFIASVAVFFSIGLLAYRRDSKAIAMPLT